MKVPARREQSEDILTFLLGVFEEGDSCEVGEVDLVTELVFFVGLVYREAVRSQDEVDWLPGLVVRKQGPKTEQDGKTDLGLARSTQEGSALEDAINLKAAVLVHRHGGNVESGARLRAEPRGAAGNIASPLDLNLRHGISSRVQSAAVVVWRGWLAMRFGSDQPMLRVGGQMIVAKGPRGRPWKACFRSFSLRAAQNPIEGATIIRFVHLAAWSAGQAWSVHPR